MIINNSSLSKRRLTFQRMKILEYLKSVKTHPTADQVFNFIKKDIPSITLATVYRNLHLLAKDNSILELNIDGELHFDGEILDHQHFICKNCKKIFDIHNSKINNYALKKVGSKNFSVSDVQINFFGFCDSCNNIGGGSNN